MYYCLRYFPVDSSFFKCTRHGGFGAYARQYRDIGVFHRNDYSWADDWHTESVQNRSTNLAESAYEFLILQGIVQPETRCAGRTLFHSVAYRSDSIRSLRCCCGNRRAKDLQAVSGVGEMNFSVMRSRLFAFCGAGFFVSADCKFQCFTVQSNHIWM